jgi:hypothetical protein
MMYVLVGREPVSLRQMRDACESGVLSQPSTQVPHGCGLGCRVPGPAKAFRQPPADRGRPTHLARATCQAKDGDQGVSNRSNRGKAHALHIAALAWRTRETPSLPPLSTTAAPR